MIHPQSPCSSCSSPHPRPPLHPRSLAAAIFGLLTVAAAFQGCAPKPYFLDPAYRPASLSGKGVYVLPVSSLQIRNEKDKEFRKDFSPKEGEAAAEILAKAFQTRIMERLLKVAAKNGPIDTPLVQAGEDTFTVRKNAGLGSKLHSQEFIVPKREALAAKGIQAQFILVIQKLVFDSRSKDYSVVHSAPAALGGVDASGSSSLLHLGFEYLLWDYGRGEAVASGEADGFASTTFYTTREDWNRIMDQALETMLDHSPLRNP